MLLHVRRVTLKAEAVKVQTEHNHRTQANQLLAQMLTNRQKHKCLESQFDKLDWNQPEESHFTSILK